MSTSTTPIPSDISELVEFATMHGAELFESETQSEQLIKAVQNICNSHEVDLSSKKARDETKSLAAKIASIKVAVDKAGKFSKEEWQRKVNEVDARRKSIKDTLQALQDATRKPVVDFEKAEESARQAIIDNFLALEDLSKVPFDATLDDIGAREHELAEFQRINDWGDKGEDASALMAAVKQILENARLQIEDRLQKEAEAERLKAEAEKAEAERREREREAAAKQAAEEAARKEQAERIAALEAEQAEKDRQLEQARLDAETAKEEARQAEARAKEEVERAEQERVRQAQEQAKREAEHKAQAEAEAKRQAEQAEADRKAAEKKAADEARDEALRQAKHDETVASAKSEIIDDLSAMAGNASPEQICDAIVAGNIRHVQMVL